MIWRCSERKLSWTRNLLDRGITRWSEFLFQQEEAMGEASDQLIVEDILAFDVSDDELEASACRDDPRIFTIAFCSQDWNYCYPG